jgi:hypothetical protein
MPLNRVVLVETFFQHWVWGGIFLIVCAALTTFDLTELGQEQNPFAIGRLGLRPEILIAILGYFLSGLWLLSQARLSVMKARWLTGRVSQQEPVEKSWQRTSFVTLLIVAGLAALLPIGSTFMISRILNTLIVSLIFLLNFIVVLFSTLFVSLFSLLGRKTPVADVGETFTVPPPPLPGGEALPPNAPSLIAGSIFWIIVFVLAIVAFIFFLRERGYRLPTWRHIWRTLHGWLNQWRLGIAAQVAKLQFPTPTLANHAGKRPIRLPRRFFRLNALSPRDQIRYFYLSTVRRASDRGTPRQQSKTPLEYSADLRENWPEAADDVTDLTQAFLKVQYRPEPVDVDEATAVKPIWKRLRAAIKQKKS